MVADKTGYHSFLLSAIGPTSPHTGLLPAKMLLPKNVDEECLSRLLVHHRIVSRFSRQLEVVPDWKPAFLLDRLALINAKEKVRILEQNTAIAELSRLQVDNQLILIKGLMIHMVSKDPDYMRASYDIDVLSAHPDKLVADLEGLGFAMHLHDSDSNEYAEAIRGNVIVDIHRYMPVWTLPAGLDSVLDQPDDGWRRQNVDQIRISSITYGDLAQGARSVSTEDGGSILVSGLEMQAILLCAHAHRHFVEPYGKFRMPLVKLGELLDIAFVTTLSDFSVERFIELVARHNAKDAVCFALRQAARFGVTPEFPGRLLQEFRARPSSGATMLTEQGCWLREPTPEQTLEWPTPQALIARSGYNRMQIYPPQALVVSPWTTEHFDDNVSITQGAIEGVGPYELLVSLHEEELRFDLHVTCHEGCLNNFVEVAFQGISVLGWIGVGSEGKVFYGGPGRFRVELQECGYSFQLAFSREAAKGARDLNGEVVALMTVTHGNYRDDYHPPFHPKAVVVIPLLIPPFR